MFRSTVTVIAFVALTFGTLVAAAEELDPRLTRSRELAARFQKELKGELQKALDEGGPVNAIAVCKEKAPQIAKRLSEESGAQVSRTSFKVRNPANAPQPWQREVLEAFEARHKAGEASDKLEHFEATAEGGAHYMKAIPTQALCVTCHGKQIAPDIRKALAQHYPRDQASGFAVGDLRGAFSIVWPLLSEKPR